jgi:hypothetical protein
MYATGGQDGTNAVLATTELSQVDIFGVPGPWLVSKQFSGNATAPHVANLLATPRSGATLLRVGRFLYAVGGASVPTDTTTAVSGNQILNDVERAEILGFETMPQIQQPQQVAGNGLPLGAWYYQVSAVTTSLGESLPSREVVVLNQGGTFRVCWSSPPSGAAASYNLYRSLAADGRSGTTRLLTVGIPQASSGSTCFNDDGQGLLAPAPGRVRGTLATGGTLAAATYSYRVSAVVSAGGSHETLGGYAADIVVSAADVTATRQTIHLAWDPLPNVTQYNVYKRVAGTYQLVGVPTAAALDDNGALAALPVGSCPHAATTACNPLDGEPALPVGSLSRWQGMAQTLNEHREGLDGVVVVIPGAMPSMDRAFLLVAGGRASNAAATPYSRTAESIEVGQDGTLASTGWVVETQQFNTPHAFYALLTTQDRNATPYPPPPSAPPCADFDGDGYKDCGCFVRPASCSAGDTTPTCACDCNDANPAVNPGALENNSTTCSNGIDDDCDGLVDCADNNGSPACSSHLHQRLHDRRRRRRPHQRGLWRRRLLRQRQRELARLHPGARGRHPPRRHRGVRRRHRPELRRRRSRLPDQLHDRRRRRRLHRLLLLPERRAVHHQLQRSVRPAHRAQLRLQRQQPQRPPGCQRDPVRWHRSKLHGRRLLHRGDADADGRLRRGSRLAATAGGRGVPPAVRDIRGAAALLLDSVAHRAVRAGRADLRHCGQGG